MKFRASLFLLLLSTMINQSYAHKSDSIFYYLNEVTIDSKSREEILNLYLPNPIVNITSEQVLALQPVNMADLIESSGSLSLQKSQQGGGSPMIRGFEASRILLMIDHVRMNNLIYRSGHLQNLITTDHNTVRQIEVTYGPSSVAYGSDALGGTIHLFTKEPVLSDEDKLKHNAELLFQVNSANTGANVHVETMQAKKTWGTYASFSCQHFGDLRSGKRKNPFLKDDAYIRCDEYVESVNGTDQIIQNDKPQIQKYSGYDQYDGVFKFLYRPSDEIKQTLNFQFSTSTDVNRYDRLTDRSGEDLKFAEWYYGPQTRWLGAYRMDHTALFHLDRVSLQLAYQNVQESRHNRKYKSDYLGSRFEKVNIFSATLDAEKNIAKHQLRFGIDMNLNWLNSSAYKTVKNSGQREPLDTRYPDGDNTMHSVDAFLMHRCPVTSNVLHWFNGLRVGGSFLHSSIVDKSFFPFPFDWIRQNNFTYSLSSSLVKMFKEDHSLALNVSTGFRVPNVDDVGKVFDSQPGSVIVPNQNLRPEQTLSADLSYKQKISDQLRFDASVYYTWLWDAIIVEPTLFAGKDSMMYDGVQSQVLHNANARKGQIYGVSLSLQHNMDRLSTDASVSYTRGMAYMKEEKTPLDHISPLFGKISVKYRYLRRKPLSRFEFFTLFSGRKDIKYYNLEGEDNIRYATVKGVAGKGLPAWFTLNARASYEAFKDLYVDCSVLNLLDTEYRTFASGINAPGRAFQFTVRYKL